MTMTRKLRLARSPGPARPGRGRAARRASAGERLRARPAHGPRPRPARPTSPRSPCTSGTRRASGSQALLTAAGLISKLPFKVTWSDFTSGPPMLQAMGAGAVDIGSVGNAPPVFAAAGGDKLAIVGAFQANPLGSALAGAEELADPLDRPAQGQADRGSPGQLGRLSPAHRAEEGRADGARRHPGLPAARRRPGRAGLRPRGRVGHLVPVRRAGRGPGPRPAAGQRGGLRQPLLVHGGVPRRAGRPGQGGRDPRLPQAARPGARLGRHPPGRLGRGVGQGHRAAGRHHGQGGQGRRGPRGADHPGGGQRPSSRSPTRSPRPG